jgi:cytochrome c oxidase cbb3-type subunit 4
MNLGTLSGVVTAILLIAFIGGWIWVWRAERKPEFDAAARLPLDDAEAEDHR